MMNDTKKLTKEIAEKICNEELPDFNCFSEIEDSAAAVLEANFTGLSLELNGLLEISDTVAVSLAKLEGEYLLLGLNGIISITDKSAIALSGFKGYTLELNGLKRISDTAAIALSGFKGKNLELNGLTNISDNTAQTLAKCNCNLDLEGLTNLSNYQAFHLSKFQRILSIGRNPEVPKHIQKMIWGENFSGFNLTDEIAELLASFSGEKFNLNIWDPTTISIRSANLLISNNKIKGLSKEIYRMASISGNKMQMTKEDAEKFKSLHSTDRERFLSSYNSLSLDAAESLSKIKKSDRLDLSFIENLDEEVANHLVNYPGELLLNGLKTITPSLAKVLINHKGVRHRGQIGPEIQATLYLDGLLEMSFEVACILIKYEGSLSFDGLKNINEKLAKVLIGKTKLFDKFFKKYYQPFISLKGLNSISKSIALILNDYPDKALIFNYEFQIICTEEENALADWFK